MSIEKFPKFNQLKLGDYPILAVLFKDNPPQISEFTFTNLFAWRNSYQINVSFLNDFIIFRCDKFAPRKFFPPRWEGRC